MLRHKWEVTDTCGESNAYLPEYFPHADWVPDAEEKRLLSEAFPVCPPPTFPMGERVLLQIRSPKKKSAGGIFLPDEARESEKWNEQTAKIIAWGPLAFRNRTTLEKWPDYQCYYPGLFVRIPLYGGDKTEVPFTESETALFVVRKDYEIISRVVGNPLSVKTCY